MRLVHHRTIALEPLERELHVVVYGATAHLAISLEPGAVGGLQFIQCGGRGWQRSRLGLCQHYQRCGRMHGTHC